MLFIINCIFVYTNVSIFIMNRLQFLNTILGGTLMASLQPFYNFTKDLKYDGNKMPVLFIGHGSPMNGIEDNSFSQTWANLGQSIPVPKAVLVVSAHWLTNGTHITAMNNPKTIHDFGGFPQALFDVEYPAPGAPDIALQASKLITETHVGMDHDWGLDHGTWTVVRHMYPKADIPVLQLSIDYHKSPEYHYSLSRQLADLRKKGVLIIGSGNMVHNLRMIAWDKMSTDYGFDWAVDINNLFKEKINNGDHKALINYQNLHKSIALAIPTPDHYYPMLYMLALQDKTDQVTIFNDAYVGGSLTMTSFMYS